MSPRVVYDNQNPNFNQQWDRGASAIVVRMIESCPDFNFRSDADLERLLKVINAVVPCYAKAVIKGQYEVGKERYAEDE